MENEHTIIERIWGGTVTKAGERKDGGGRWKAVMPDCNWQIDTEPGRGREGKEHELGRIADT